MHDDRKSELLTVLAAVNAGLARLARASESEVASASSAFKSLASAADTILKQAAAIVAYVEKESMGAVLPSVQSLCVTVREFLERRLEAATTILGTLEQQEKLLGELTIATQSQDAVSRHLRALSVLTNVEVAHLGSAGGNFQLLAQELCTFSKSLAVQTLELASDTEKRKETISDTKREMAGSLPRLRAEMARMEQDIGNTLQVIETSLRDQTGIPQQFRQGAEQTSQQIAGVVSAIQAHDITRQQIEHVQASLTLIASRMSADDSAGSPSQDDWPAAYSGLNIQIYQLKAIRRTVSIWTSQVRTCMQGIQRLSASGVVGIGPAVLHQERELSAQLAHIATLEQKSQDYSGRMQQTVGGLSSLAELVTEHLNRFQAIRDRLQILMFNSLIEAQRLGSRGTVVASIASLIKGVSADWNTLADKSRMALGQMSGLVERTSQLMDVFSQASCQKLREHQSETRSSLDSVRGAAAFVAREAAQMQSATNKMKASLASVGDTGDRLEGCFAGLDTAIEQLERLHARLFTEDPQVGEGCDAAEVQSWLSSCYTTEIERAVMNSALHGEPLPAAEQSLVGNAVELF